MRRGNLLLRDLMYLYTSIFCAAIQNIVTQMFFDRYNPENKELLLFTTLFCGAVCTMLGILVSSRVRKTRAVPLIGMITAVILSFAGLFYVRTFWIYTILFCIASFFINYVYNTFDIYITATVRPEERERNVRILLGYQMAGYLISPLFFSVFASRPWVCIAFSVLLGLCSYVPVGIEYLKAPQPMPIKKEDRIQPVTYLKQDRKPMLYCFFMFMAVYILMPSVAYLLKDYLGVSGYAVRSSLFLGGIVLFSSVVILCCSAPGMWRIRIASPLILIGSLMALLLLRSGHTAVLVTTAVISGSGYGIFLSGSRHYVNTADAGRRLIARYNQVMTGASLLGYLISALIGWFCTRGGMSVVPVKYSVILFLFAAAAACTGGEKQRPDRRE